MGIIGYAQTLALRSWLLFKALVHQRAAEPWLALLSFFESFLIAIPVDPFLAAMVIADRTRWVWVATVATMSSTIGAVAGYLIGFFAFDLASAYFLDLTSSSELLTKLVALFADHAVVLTFAAALTPLPNGPVVVAAGFVGTNFFWFFIAWLVARAMRFFGVAYIAYAFGTDTLTRSERALNIATIACTLVVVGWVVWRAAGI